MISLRHILADNLKENRKRLGISQAKLAERADTSTQHIAMIEISRKFPSPEMLERIANALGMEAYELFMVKPSQEDAIAQLHKALIDDMRITIKMAIKEELTEIKGL